MSREPQIDLWSSPGREALQLGIMSAKIPFRLNEFWEWSLQDISPPSRIGTDGVLADDAQTGKSPLPVVPEGELQQINHQVREVLLALALNGEAAGRIIEATEQLLDGYRGVWGTDFHCDFRRTLLAADHEASALLHLSLYHTADGARLDPMRRQFVVSILEAASSLAPDARRAAYLGRCLGSLVYVPRHESVPWEANRALGQLAQESALFLECVCQPECRDTVNWLRHYNRELLIESAPVVQEEIVWQLRYYAGRVLAWLTQTDKAPPPKPVPAGYLGISWNSESREVHRQGYGTKYIPTRIGPKVFKRILDYRGSVCPYEVIAQVWVEVDPRNDRPNRNAVQRVCSSINGILKHLNCQLENDRSVGYRLIERPQEPSPEATLPEPAGIESGR